MVKRGLWLIRLVVDEFGVIYTGAVFDVIISMITETVRLAEAA